MPGGSNRYDVTQLALPRTRSRHARPSALSGRPARRHSPYDTAPVNAVRHGRYYPHDSPKSHFSITLIWPHAGFHVHDAVWVPEDDRACVRRLARYCARNPVALERLTYDADARQVSYRSDTTQGPTGGRATAD